MISFTSKTISGSSRGSKIGFPTINLESTNQSSIEPGVYACKTWWPEEVIEHIAVLHCGLRPTFSDSYTCEIHVINKNIEYLPVECTVTVYKKLRDIQKFADVPALKKQIEIDIMCTEEYFKLHE